MITEGEVSFARNDAITAVEALRGSMLEEERLIQKLAAQLVRMLSDYIDTQLARFGVTL